jgi:hypothetical protein
VSVLGAANVESLRLIAPAQSKCCLLRDDIYIIDAGLCAVNESRSVGRTRNRDERGSVAGAFESGFDCPCVAPSMMHQVMHDVETVRADQADMRYCSDHDD